MRKEHQKYDKFKAILLSFKNKHLKNVLEKWKFPLIAIISILLMPVLVYKVSTTPGEHGFIRESDAGAWLTYYGSVLGGGITLYGVVISIKKQEALRKQDQEDLENRRKEDQRMSVMPFFSYKISDSKFEDRKIDNYDRRLYPMGDPNKLEPFTDKMIDVEIKNLGLGIAVFPSITTILYCGVETDFPSETSFSVGPGETAFARFDCKYPDNTTPTLRFTIGYYDMLNYYYKQDVTISFEFYLGTQIGILNYHSYIHRVEKPVLSDPLKK